MDKDESNCRVNRPANLCKRKRNSKLLWLRFEWGIKTKNCVIDQMSKKMNTILMSINVMMNKLQRQKRWIKHETEKSVNETRRNSFCAFWRPNLWLSYLGSGVNILVGSLRILADVFVNFIPSICPTVHLPSVHCSQWSVSLSLTFLFNQPAGAWRGNQSACLVNAW